MLESNSQSAILIYHSPCATSLNGTIITFIECVEKPVIFSVISKNFLLIYMINPEFNIGSFLIELKENSGNFQIPLNLFEYDLLCLRKYDSTYNLGLYSFFTSYDHVIIDTLKFSNLEDFYSYTLPECYGPFFNYDMYSRFSQTSDFTEISNFVRSIMFSKLVLLIDLLSTHYFIQGLTKEINIVIQGRSVISLPENSCLLDIQTTGLNPDSKIILFSLYSGNSYTSYFLNDTSLEGQENFRAFIEHSFQFFESIYVFNNSFEKIFFPECTKFIDIKFNKYKYWTTARQIVHLPFYHIEFDPGSGKNVPIWYSFYFQSQDETWKKLLLMRTVVNILTKLAILSTNEIFIPFNDPIIADLRRVKPKMDFLKEFKDSKKNLLKKKIFYHPIEFFITYKYANGQYSEMYCEKMLSFDEKDTEGKL